MVEKCYNNKRYTLDGLLKIRLKARQDDDKTFGNRFRRHLIK